MELAMNVAADGDWRIDRHHIALLDQDLTCLKAKLPDSILGDRTAGAEIRNMSR